MDAHDTIDELYRIARLPEIDDAQLDTLVAALDSQDSYFDQEDGGYGSSYSRETEWKVSESAEGALREAAHKVRPRLVERLRDARGPARDALLRLVAGERS